jgi:hypothetical protein
MTQITFIPIADTLPEYNPKPASKTLPEWYKKTSRYVNGEKEVPKKEDSDTSATIKACIPVYDAMTSGYILFTQSDLWVWDETNEETGKLSKHFRWGANQPIEFHSVDQFSEHPKWNEFANAYKFVNSWIINTPKGYSCLFTAPFQHVLPYKIIDGVVDTDNYYNPINFPFVFTDTSFTGFIPAGSPIVQIIPFKREKWNMQLKPWGQYEKEINHTKLQLISHFFDRYKKKFWSPKEYT